MTPANEAAFLVAFAYIALILATFWLGAVLAPHVARITRGWFGETADRLPEAELLKRDEDWFDHPAYRQDIARTRRDLTKRRMTEESWKRASGQDIA